MQAIWWIVDGAVACGGRFNGRGSGVHNGVDASGFHIGVDMTLSRMADYDGGTCVVPGKQALLFICSQNYGMLY